MDDLRDLVSGQDTCDDGSASYRNPLGRFVDHLYRDKSQREQMEWRERPQELNTKHEQRLNTHTYDTQAHVERFFNNFDDHGAKSLDPLNAFQDGLSFDEFESFMQGAPQPEVEGLEGFDRLKVSNEVPPDLLKFYIKSFIDSSHNQHTFRPMHMPDLGLSESDKMKIRGRSGVLARHMFPTQGEEFINSQLNSFLHTIDDQRSGFHNNHHRSMMDNRGRDFVDEFLATPHHHHHQEQPLSELDMERFYQEGVRSHEMAREFEEFQREQEFESAFQEGRETQNWVNEFESKSKPVDLQSLTESITQIDDPKLQKTNFMKFMTRLSKGELAFEGNQVVEKTPQEIEAEGWANEFAARQREDQHGNFQEYSEEWVNEYAANNPSWDEIFDRGDHHALGEEENDWLAEYDIMARHGHVRPYEFVDASLNPYLHHPQPFEKGLELFQDGKISDSILAFEAELRNHPENSVAWQHLGQAHAENDKDTQAISALNRAIELDPQNRNAMMSLAVSYTNDLYRDQALETLRNWLESHPDYNRSVSLHKLNEEAPFEMNHNAVANMFMEAARLRAEDPDPDVQTALGLLFNLSLDYDKAIDCFKAALTVRPEDYLLWNKLGATLANSSRSEEALGCYFKALEAKPSYVRARANLGISFMALKQYDRAAQYFLGAISMHPEARHIWTNLQMVFLSMGREDLVEKTVANDVNVFRDEYDF